MTASRVESRRGSRLVRSVRPSVAGTAGMAFVSLSTSLRSRPERLGMISRVESPGRSFVTSPTGRVLVMSSTSTSLVRDEVSVRPSKRGAAVAAVAKRKPRTAAERILMVGGGLVEWF